VPASDAAADGVINSMVDTAPRIVLPITPPERSPPALACLSPPRQRNGSGDKEEDEKHEADDETREAKIHRQACLPAEGSRRRRPAGAGLEDLEKVSQRALTSTAVLAR
jgi:hypothetical protein